MSSEPSYKSDEFISSTLVVRAEVYEYADDEYPIAGQMCISDGYR